MILNEITILQKKKKTKKKIRFVRPLLGNGFLYSLTYSSWVKAKVFFLRVFLMIETGFIEATILASWSHELIGFENLFILSVNLIWVSHFNLMMWSISKFTDRDQTFFILEMNWIGSIDLLFGMKFFFYSVMIISNQ